MRVTVEVADVNRNTVPTGGQNVADCCSRGNGALDLVGLATRGLNYLTRNPAPNPNAALHYLPFFGGKIPLRGVPRFERTPWDYGDGTGRFLEALILCREMTGEQGGQHVDEALAHHLCSFLNEGDGLSYRPDTPWSEFGADMWAQRGTLLALSLLYERTGDEAIRGRLGRLVDGLASIAIRDQGSAYLRYFWTSDGWLTEENAGICFCVLDGLVKCFEATANEKAMRLAIDLARGMIHRRPAYFHPDGSFGYPGMSERPEMPDVGGSDRIPEVAVAWEIANGHVTSRVAAAAGMVRLGVLTGDREFIEAGKSVHDWVSTRGSQFGWIPENLRTAGQESNELCNLAGMLEIQVLLAVSGYPEYWDCAQRFVRNHLAASQFMVTPELLDLVQSDVGRGLPVDSDRFSYSEVLSRLEGGFAGPTYPDDMFSAYPKSRQSPDARRVIDISGCCAPSGVKALWLAWDSALTRDDRGIWVNLAMDHRSGYAAVESHLPREGRVDVTVMDQSPVHIRLPEWVKPSDAKLFVDGRETRLQTNGRYVICQPGLEGRTLSIRYPVAVRREQEVLAGIPYLVTWRGDTVASVEAETPPILALYK